MSLLLELEDASFLIEHKVTSSCSTFVPLWGPFCNFGFGLIGLLGMLWFDSDNINFSKIMFSKMFNNLEHTEY